VSVRRFPVLLMTAFADAEAVNLPWAAVSRGPFALDVLVAALDKAILTADKG
jgi:hypothetical protein